MNQNKEKSSINLYSETHGFQSVGFALCVNEKHLQPLKFLRFRVEFGVDIKKKQKKKQKT